MAIWLASCTEDQVQALTDASGDFDGGAAKVVWHSTEGASYAGARSAYAASGNGPHITIDVKGRRAFQHLSLDRSASALVHAAGQGDTNRDYAIQVELVGFSSADNGEPAVPAFTTADMAFVARIARDIEARAGVPRRSGLVWKSYPASFGANGVRMDWSTWNAFAGHCGHQHVPENDHGDPGAFDVAAMLGLAPPPAPTPAPTPKPRPVHQEDEMPSVVNVPAGGEGVIPVPPPHGGGIYGKGYGNVWVSLARDFAADPARVALGSPAGWRWAPGADSNGYVVVPVGRKLILQLQAGDEIVSIRNDRSAHPIGVMVEAELAL